MAETLQWWNDQIGFKDISSGSESETEPGDDVNIQELVKCARQKRRSRQAAPTANPNLPPTPPSSAPLAGNTSSPSQPNSPSPSQPPNPLCDEDNQPADNPAMNTGEDDIPENNNTGSTNNTTSPPLPPTPPFDFSQLIQGPLATQLMQWIAQQHDSSNGGPRPISSSTATVNPGQATEPPALNLPHPRPVTASRRATTNNIRAESPPSEVPDSEGEDQAAEATRMKNLKRAKENTGRGSKSKRKRKN